MSWLSICFTVSRPTPIMISTAVPPLGMGAIFEGAELRLNYATSAAGSIHVELQDEYGVPLPGFAMEDAEPIFGDCLDGAVSWAAGFDLSTLRGRPVRIRMRLRDADVFALRFA